MKCHFPLLILLGLLTACTTTDEIIIDKQGVDLALSLIHI